MRLTTLLPAGLLLAATLAQPATAATTTFRFGGNITQVDPTLGAHVQVGNPYTIDITFNPAEPPIFPGATFQMFYLQDTSLAIHGTGGLLTANVSTPAPNINNSVAVENNNSGRDAFVPSVGIGLLNPGNGHVLEGYMLNSISLFLLDSTRAAFSAPELPPSIALGNFGLRFGTLQYFDGVNPGREIRFGITSFELNPGAAVPEPAHWAALAGLAALGWCAWRRRRA